MSARFTLHDAVGREVAGDNELTKAMCDEALRLGGTIHENGQQIWPKQKEI